MTDIADSRKQLVIEGHYEAGDSTPGVLITSWFERFIFGLNHGHHIEYKLVLPWRERVAGRGLGVERPLPTLNKDFRLDCG